MQGYDIASVNGPRIIDRALGGDFTIVKATEGRTWDDPLHDVFVSRLRAAGKLVGHYHYAWPENGGRADAEHFIARAQARDSEVLALDFEPFKTKAPESAWGPYVQEFATVVRDAAGQWPWLYSEDYHLGKLTRAPQAGWIRATLPLWKAGVSNAYTEDPAKGPGNTFGFARTVCYQWSGTGIDKDLFYGDRNAWLAVAVGGSQDRAEPDLVGSTGFETLVAAAAEAARRA